VKAEWSALLGDEWRRLGALESWTLWAQAGLLFGMVVSFALLTSTALVLTGLAVLWHPPRRRGTTLAAGLCAGLAVAFRPDVALLALLPALPLLHGSGRWRAWWGGAALGSLPLWISLLVTPGGWVRDVLLGRASIGAGQSRSPMPADGDPRLLLTLLLLSVALAVLAAAVTRSPRATALALAALLCLPQAFQRADRIHFLYAALFCVPFLPQQLTAVLRHPRFRLEHPAVLGVTLSTLFVFVGTSLSVVRPIVETALGDGLTSVDVRHDGRSLPENGRRAAALRQLLPVLDDLTRDGGTLMVFDEDLVRPAVNDLSVYFLMPHARQHAFSLEINPGVTNPAKGKLLRDVERADVLVLVTVTDTERRTVFPFEKDGPRDAQDEVERSFCPVTTIDYYRVLKRCRGAA
jgi:hypothetical protein